MKQTFLIFPSLLEGLMCLTAFTVSLIFTMGSGNYWLEIFNSYVGSVPLLIIAFFEIISVVYIYGINRWRCNSSSSSSFGYHYASNIKMYLNDSTKCFHLSTGLMRTLNGWQVGDQTSSGRPLGALSVLSCFWWFLWHTSQSRLKNDQHTTPGTQIT